MENKKYSSFAVIGLGRYGFSVARTLGNAGVDVLACDRNEDRVEDVSSYVTKAMVCDCTDEDVLKDLGLKNVDVVIIAIGSNIEASIITTLMVKELGAKFIVSKANNKSHAKVLAKIGANRIVFPEKDMGIKTAQSFISPNFMEMINLQDDYSIAEIKVPESWIGKSLVELNLRKKYVLNVIGISVKGDVSLAIDPEEPLKKDTILFIIGNIDDINKIANN